jgi:hypothetical protein
MDCCHYCKKAIWFGGMRKESDFCCEDHRHKYHNVLRRSIWELDRFEAMPAKPRDPWLDARTAEPRLTAHARSRPNFRLVRPQSPPVDAQQTWMMAS